MKVMIGGSYSYRDSENMEQWAKVEVELDETDLLRMLAEAGSAAPEKDALRMTAAQAFTALEQDAQAFSLLSLAKKDPKKFGGAGEQIKAHLTASRKALVFKRVDDVGDDDA